MVHNRIPKNHSRIKKNIPCRTKLGRKLFLKAGYIQDCHNRYAIPGRGSFLQEDYVFEDQSIIGFGAGARTYANNVHYRNSFYPQNHRKAIQEYMKEINSKKLNTKTGTVLSKKEKLHQYAIYNIESLDKKEFETKFKQKFKHMRPGGY